MKDPHRDEPTSGGAAALGLQASHGSIERGKRANLLVFRDSRNDPLASFFALTARDIDMVLHEGVMVYGDEAFRSACVLDFDSFSEVLVDGRREARAGPIRPTGTARTPGP